MRTLKGIFEQNKQWADRVRASDPDFFKKLSEQQNPEYLWIGCADSRVPANQIIDALPGEVFVHRNIANICQSGCGRDRSRGANHEPQHRRDTPGL